MTEQTAMTPADGAGFRRGAVPVPPALSPTHPRFPHLAQLAAVAPAPVAARAAALVALAPQQGRDPRANGGYLAVECGTRLFAAVERAAVRVEPLLLAASECAEDAAGHVAEAEQAMADLAVLDDEVVTVPALSLALTRRDIAARNRERIAAGDRAVARGDEEHLQPQTAGVLGWAVTIALSALEVFGLYLLLANVVLPITAATVFPFVIFLTISAALVLGNHLVPKFLGGAIRTWRDRRSAREDRAGYAFQTIHHTATTDEETR